jgi:hypothetical protein
VRCWRPLSEEKAKPSRAQGRRDKPLRVRTSCRYRSRVGVRSKPACSRSASILITSSSSKPSSRAMISGALPVRDQSQANPAPPSVLASIPVGRRKSPTELCAARLTDVAARHEIAQQTPDFGTVKVEFVRYPVGRDRRARQSNNAKDCPVARCQGRSVVSHHCPRIHRRRNVYIRGKPKLSAVQPRSLAWQIATASIGLAPIA